MGFITKYAAIPSVSWSNRAMYCVVDCPTQLICFNDIYLSTLYVNRQIQKTQQGNLLGIVLLGQLNKSCVKLNFATRIKYYLHWKFGCITIKLDSTMNDGEPVYIHIWNPITIMAYMGIHAFQNSLLAIYQALTSMLSIC